MTGKLFYMQIRSSFRAWVLSGLPWRNLEKYGLVELIHEIVENNTPFLGICLGLQLLFEESEEAPGVKGLGNPERKDLTDTGSTKDLKIPHMGWNSLKLSGDGRLFKDLPEDPYVYFVHSYYLKAEEPIHREGQNLVHAPYPSMLL